MVGFPMCYQLTEIAKEYVTQWNVLIECSICLSSLGSASNGENQ